MSGIACIICGLLQGATNPTLQGLQVNMLSNWKC